MDNNKKDNMEKELLSKVRLYTFESSFIWHVLYNIWTPNLHVVTMNLPRATSLMINSGPKLKQTTFFPHLFHLRLNSKTTLGEQLLLSAAPRRCSSLVTIHPVCNFSKQAVNNWPAEIFLSFNYTHVFWACTSKTTKLQLNEQQNISLLLLHLKLCSSTKHLLLSWLMPPLWKTQSGGEIEEFHFDTR